MHYYYATLQSLQEGKFAFAFSNSESFMQLWAQKAIHSHSSVDAYSLSGYVRGRRKAKERH
jgi:hypothetical protein